MSVCYVCQGPQRAEIEDALMSGASLRALATQFGVSKSAIGRHRANCLQPKLAAAARIVAPPAQARSEVARAKEIAAGGAPTAADVLSLSSLLERLGRSLERLEGAADHAAADNLHTSLAAVSGQLHRGIETAAKIQGLGAEQASEGPRFSIIITPSGGPALEPGLVKRRSIGTPYRRRIGTPSSLVFAFARRRSAEP
jgi:hypothetical protein